MADAKPKVTLIGTDLARKDLEFVYEGQLPECEPCSVKKACNNLRPGRRYRIVEVRKAQHRCPVHLNGALSVEVEESVIPVLISADMAIKNTRIAYEFLCNREGCGNYDLCHPDGIIEGDKYVVAEVLGPAPEGCEKGRNLQRVDLKPL